MIGSYEYFSTEQLSRYHVNFLYDELSRLTHVYQTVNYKVGDSATAEDEIDAQYIYNSAGRLEQSNYTAGGYSSLAMLTYDGLGASILFETVYADLTFFIPIGDHQLSLTLGGNLGSWIISGIRKGQAFCSVYLGFASQE